MAFFIKPSIEKTTYLRGEKIINEPININVVTSILKSRTNWYPDNEGLPSILFRIMGNMTLSWVYREEKDRDKDYERLLKSDGH